VQAVVFAPDGRRVSTGTMDGMVRIFNTASGNLVRSFQAHRVAVKALAISGDGSRLLSAGADKLAVVWNATTGERLRELSGHTDEVHFAALSARGDLAATGGIDRALKIWNVGTGRLIHTLAAPLGEPLPPNTAERSWRRMISMALSPDCSKVVAGYNDGAMHVWDTASGRLLRSTTDTDRALALGYAPDGNSIAIGGFSRAKIADASSGEVKQLLHGAARIGGRAEFSADGRSMVSTAMNGGISLWDLGAGRQVRTYTLPDDADAFAGHVLWRGLTLHGASYEPDRADDPKLDTAALPAAKSGAPAKRAFSSFNYDRAQRLLVTTERYKEVTDKTRTVRVWEPSTGRLILTLEVAAPGMRFFDNPTAALSPDGTRVLIGLYTSLKLYDVASGRAVYTFAGHTDAIQSVLFSDDGASAVSTAHDRTIRLWNARTGELRQTLSGHRDSIWKAIFAAGGMRIVSGSQDHTVKIWDARTGKAVRTLEGHVAGVDSLSVSPDGKRLLSASRDGMAILWELETGRRLASFILGREGQWLAMTPQGFFNASHRNPRMLALVRGTEATSIAQVHQSLYSPDLLREALAADPAGEVRDAAEVVSLDKVLDSGPAPAVAIASPADRSRVPSDLATVSARIEDRGKGIGRIEWRVNGTTVAVASAAGKGTDLEVKEELAFDPGDNSVEVVAYNGSNLLASVPSRITVRYDGGADTRKPTLHVLAIGVDAYRSKIFSRLNFAAQDARATGDALKMAAGGLYENVRVTTLIDQEATLAKLDSAFEKLKSEVHPRDTFIFFASAHGYSQHGRFFLIPPDYPDTLEALFSRAISQERLQDWIANRIKARRAVLLLDTCESGALVGGHTQSRINQPSSEAAIGRLHEATGRPVLTAAASGKAAFEGYKGHGIFTWALLDALQNADTNANGTIELSELAAHVQNLVPKLGIELGSPTRGFVVVGPAESTTGASPPVVQAARFGARGEDFVIARRLQ
jgi:WD40 repeat protein